MMDVRKSGILQTIPLLITIFSLSFPAQAQYGGGSGEPNDPYLIYTPEQMNAIGAEPNDWDKNFKLMTDIDLSEYSGDALNIIGECCFESGWIDEPFLIAHPFTGIFDGNGHIISNLSYTSTNSSYIGLFGFVGTWGKEAVIKDLGLIDPNVNAGTGSYVGSLVGVLKNGTVTNCYVEGGSVVGGDCVGGLVGAYGEEMRGYPDPPFTISNCYSTSSVEGSYRVGGLVGSNYEGRITNSYSTGNVSGKWDVGGLVGHNGSTWHWPPTPGTILNCYSTGLVSGEFNVGGLVGRHVAGTVIGCLWDMVTSGQTRSARGAGKVTTEMKTADTFAAWGGCGNEGIWTIDEGNDYPRLWWESKSGILLKGQLSDFLQGAGTEDEPYLIYTAEQINRIGVFPCEWDKNFKLMADVDLNGFTGTEFNIIGIDWANPFTGVFDGNGHTISNFSYISTDRDRAGLFGYVNDPNAEIRDLGLIDPNVDAGTGWDVGSLVGSLRSGTITGCHVNGGSVSGNEIVGGLVGYSWYGAITNCYSITSVTGDERVGGLVGLASSKYIGERTEITNCYSVGSVTGNFRVGGLAGVNSGTIINCYSVTSVFGNDVVGGLVGVNSGTITNSYSVGSITGDERVGGLTGRNSGIVSNCFWDVETSGQTTSAGGIYARGIGKTTAEMQTVSTFIDAGWDFVDETSNGTDDIWWINEGQDYPRLWWQYGLAFSPYPQDGAIDVIQPVILNWLPGGSDLDHDVYFSEDEEVVANATTESPGIYRGRLPVEITTYDPGKLDLDKTYYWRIDEVNEYDPNSPWKGNVWSFTTANFIVVDDFESYVDIGHEGMGRYRIYHMWIDGFENPAVNGAVVGDFPELIIVHSGRQSMPLYYFNNVVGNSEATANIHYLEIGQDWTIEGVEVLSLWFYGNASNAAERMYVALANADGPTAVVYHDNPNATQVDTWTEWRIDLQRFADQGVNLANVNSITLGLGNRNNPVAGGSGMLYFDDIRLYRPPEPEPEL